MSGAFLVAVDGAPAIQKDAFTRHLQTVLGIAWWHFLSDVWLIHDPRGTMGVVEWRDAVKAFMPAAFVMVTGVERGVWALYGPEAGFKWLRDYWGGSEG